MTQACLDYIQKVVSSFPISGAVLEIGSLNVNGSPRSIFSDRERFPSYFGIDMREGPDVDEIQNSQALRFPDKSFDIVVSAEMLEHDSRFWISLSEMHRVLKAGGIAIITTRGIHFMKHDYPSDYWRFTAEGLREALLSVGFEVLESIEDNIDHGVFATARR